MIIKLHPKIYYYFNVNIIFQKAYYFFLEESTSYLVQKIVPFKLYAFYLLSLFIYYQNVVPIQS